MKFSEKWLREWVSPRGDAHALAERLTMAGLEVGGIEPVASKIKNVVVGEILATRLHPDRENLIYCEVNSGGKKPLSIICGASNAAAGKKIPVALEGAVLPQGRVIQKLKIQGMASEGMLCSAADLGLEESSQGLMILDRSAPIGASIVKYLDLEDLTLELELTPNRGDCMSVAGVAREVAAITGVRLQPIKIVSIPAKSRRRFPVALRAGNACPRYVGRVIENIRLKTITPVWMVERLRRSGIRSLHPVVDVMNYVMLELGQPMHAFDLDRLTKDIIVRSARADEQLKLLDGNIVKIPPGMLVIADAKAPVALAGIMGGYDSAVTTDTQHLFLESAYFSPDALAGRARTLGMLTESSQRFERGVDPNLPRKAIERATVLLRQIVGGVPGPVVEASAKKGLPRISSLTLRHTRLIAVLGIDIPAREVESLLLRLGMQVKKITQGWRVRPPTYRFDIAIEADLIEEIARLRGYEKIPAKQPKIQMTLPPSSETQIDTARLRSLLVDRDYQEVITYSFVDPKLQELVEPTIKPLSLKNPISEEMGVMRTSLWPGLLQSVIYNQNRQQTRMRFFEIGRSFVPTEAEGLKQERILAGVLTGTAWAEQWGLPTRAVDYFDVKADIEALAALRGASSDCRFSSLNHPALHPTQSATIYFGVDRVGSMGVLHPSLQAKLGLNQTIALFELSMTLLSAAKTPYFSEVSKFPAIRRDLAVVVPIEVPAQAIIDNIVKVAGKLLVNLQLFDEYRGEGVDSGSKSLALGLTLQNSSRTLKEEEIEQLMSRVVSILAAEWGAQLRH